MTDIPSPLAVAWYLEPRGVQIASISIGRVFDKVYFHGLLLKPGLIICSRRSTSLGVAILKQVKRGTHAVVLPFDANVQISAYFALCCDVSSNRSWPSGKTDATQNYYPEHYSWQTLKHDCSHQYQKYTKAHG